jgi:aryl-alcohol dehydrogenase-like predicted oxidoreductase
VRAIQLPIGRSHAASLATLLPELQAQGIAVIGREVFEGVARESGQAVLQLALREAANRPGVAVVLVGMSRKAHLEANLAALA